LLFFITDLGSVLVLLQREFLCVLDDATLKGISVNSTSSFSKTFNQSKTEPKCYNRYETIKQWNANVKVMSRPITRKNSTISQTCVQQQYDEDTHLYFFCSRWCSYKQTFSTWKAD